MYAMSSLHFIMQTFFCFVHEQRKRFYNEAAFYIIPNTNLRHPDQAVIALVLGINKKTHYLIPQPDVTSYHTSSAKL
jgi:hypothetical protein